jgi:DNA-binding HxlR family transcriptional regulator
VAEGALRTPPGETLGLIERKWACAILWCLLEGELRFSELKVRISGITDTTLTDRLKDLVAAGVIKRRIVGDWGRGAAYELADPKDDLRSMFEAMQRWHEAVIGTKP